jgi:hypothetical protein
LVDKAERAALPLAVQQVIMVEALVADGPEVAAAAVVAEHQIFVRAAQH